MDDSVTEDGTEFLDKISDVLGSTLPLAEENLKMVVTIPAKNEGADIQTALFALANQKTKNGTSFNNSIFEILVLCHNCLDDTFQKCVNFANAYPEIHLHVLELNSTTANTVGAARRILMNIAYQRLSHYNGFIISTDADTVVDEMWLQQISTYLDTKISLVCGFISPNLEGVKDQALIFLKAKDVYLSLKAHLESRLLPQKNDPWPRHNFNWGPNLAIKKEVYKAIGGIRPFHFLEDVDMYNRVVSRGYLVRHCLETKVTTSTRTDSRCGEGFGAELKVWTNCQGVEYNVEGLNKLLVRYEIYGLLKSYYRYPSKGKILKISSLCGIEINYLQSLLNSQSFEAAKVDIDHFLNKSESWNYVNPNISILKAVSELEAYFSTSISTVSDNV